MKLKVFFVILLLSSISVIAQNKDEESLKSLVKQMADAQQNYDAETLDKIFTADYIEISPLGEFDPREKVLGFYKPELKPPDDKMSATTEIAEFSIRTYDKFAIVIARFNYSIVVEGKAMPPRSIRVTLVCRQEGSDWKIASAQYTGIRPPQPQQPTKTE